MLINHNINSLIGGVSQQPEENRFDNQVQEMDNFQVTIAQGLRRRNPLKYVSIDGSPTTLITDFGVNGAIHAYDRGDGLFKFGIIVDANGIRVFDINGNQKTVNIVGTNPFTVWGTSLEWYKDIKFLTVGDTTWILNKKQVVSASNEAASSAVHKAFYWVSRSFNDGQDGGYTYEVKLDGIIYTASSTTSIGAATTLGDSILAAGYSVKRVGSIIRISKDSAFSFESGDSWGNQASKGWIDSVAKIQDLPADIRGFTEADVGTIAITGTDRDQFTNYYLKWNGNNWVETYKDGFKMTIDKTTMPAKLVQTAADTFSFGFVQNLDSEGFRDNWSSRTKGDEDSNPTPSFVSRQITNMFFFKNRLGFTSEENVILSETGEYYNFFATTAMEVLDADPIDAAVDSDTVSIIRNVNATGGALTIWADDNQFLLAGGEVLSPATTRISQISSYATDNSLAPIVVDNEILFFNKRGSYLDVLVYSPATLQADKSSAESISSHIPTYLPSTIKNVEVSSTNNMVFFQDASDDGVLYVYKYYIKGQERVVSSFFKWTFNGHIIKAIKVLSDVLFLMIDANKICKIDLEPLEIGDSFLDIGSVPYTSSVVMSKFNLQTAQGNQIIREPFYIKNIKTKTTGSIDFTILNEERDITTIVNKKYLNRKLIVGGNSDKTRTGFSTSYTDGCQIDTISIEGRITVRSKNI